MLLGLAAAIGLWSVPAAADVPDLISFSTTLNDEGGEPLEGPLSLTLGIWDQASGGTTLYQEIHIGAVARSGVVEVLIGDGIATAAGSFPTLSDAVFGSPARWLEIAVNNETLAPRVPFVSIPFALRARFADDADTLGGVPSAEFQRRIAGSCPSGSSIRAIDPDGGVVCADDTGAFFAAGEGLQLVGTRFAVDGDVVQLRVANGCPPGSFIRDIGADGTVTCEPDDDTDTTLAAGLGLTLFDGIFETDAVVVQRRVTGACPAGQAIASIRSDGAVACVATNGGDIDGVLAPAGSGLDAIGCGSGTCTLRVDANETQRAIGSCPADFGVAAVDALGNVTCVELFAGTAESLRTTSGLTGGCESGTCDLSIDPDVIQRRITSSCPSGSAMRSAQDFADVSCQSVFPGDITAIETQSGRGLDGGCTSDRCELSLAPGDFFRTRYESETGADVVGTTFPNGQVIEQASITAPASFGGRVLAIATATAYCGNDCISGLGTGLGAVLLTDDRSQNMLIQPETRRVTSTRDDWTTVVLQRTFSLSAGEPLTVYLRAYSDVVDFSELSIASARVSLAFIPF